VYSGYRYNRLANESFESCLSSWSLYQGQYACYTGGYEYSKMIEFNSGVSAYAVVYQDLIFTVQAGRDLLRGEAGIRCNPTNSGDCPIKIAVWGEDNGPENAWRSYVIPRNGAWYGVNMDLVAFGRTHNWLRLEIYNDLPNRNIDIDFMTVQKTDIL
jgi:hypothetical protein